MSGFEPTPEDFERAYLVVAEVLSNAGNPNLSDGDIRERTSEVLSICYSIGAAFTEEAVRSVAESVARRRKELPY